MSGFINSNEASTSRQRKSANAQAQAQPLEGSYAKAKNFSNIQNHTKLERQGLSPAAIC
jgi:hypothetical protein